MKHLTFLLFWLSVLLLSNPAQAAPLDSIAFNPTQSIEAKIATNATESSQTSLLSTPNPDAPVGTSDKVADLPPPPPADNLTETPIAVSSPSSTTPAVTAPTAKPIALTFSLSAATPTRSASSPPPRSSTSAPVTPANSANSLDSLFAGDSNSLVAKAVGSAEGTRTPDGARNPAYFGHVDPGNGVWNLGSFSYQHAATSPEEADAKQLARLRQQAALIVEQATNQGLDLTLQEQLNGIDLANQAPKAALDREGYVDWLVRAKQEGQGEAAAVLSARVRSFLNPETKRWDAPGLGNSEKRITADQARRMDAIARAIDYQMQVAENGADRLLNESAAEAFPSKSHSSEVAQVIEAENTDEILHLNLSTHQ